MAKAARPEGRMSADAGRDLRVPTNDQENQKAMSEIKTHFKEQILANVTDSKMSQWVSLEDHQRAIEAAYKDAANIATERGKSARATYGICEMAGCDMAAHAILARLEQIKKGVGG